MMLKKKPNCAPAAFPLSMPHADENKACRFILETFPQTPFFPALPGMARMFLGGMPCLTVDRKKKTVFFDTSGDATEALTNFYEKYMAEDLDFFSMSREVARSIYAMVDYLKGKSRPDISQMQFQVYGPVSFCFLLKNENQKAIFYDETWRDVVIKTLIMKAKWQELKAQEALPGIDTLVVWHEPSLSMVGSSFATMNKDEIINILNECFEAMKSKNCVHCCGNTDWSILTETHADIIHFDSYEFGQSIALFAPNFKIFIEKGGALGWGAVPVSNEAIEKESFESLLTKLEKDMGLFIKQGIDRDQLLASSYVSPCCSTDRLTQENAEKAYRWVVQLSRGIKKRVLNS